MKAFILAGGLGSRLRPYTTVLPKPLMPVGSKTILEIIIEQLRDAGINDVSISVGYLAELIEAYFGDGGKFGVKISYLNEVEPLGTAGALSNYDSQGEQFIVLNGDILTDIDFKSFYHNHLASASKLTIATYEKVNRVQLGVLVLDNELNVKGYIEKPTHKYLVSTGIYCCDAEILSRIPKGKYDMPDLVLDLLSSGEIVKSFLHQGQWLDIGNPEDYEAAQILVNSIEC